MNSDIVCFAHGKESGPRGRKINALADVALKAGFDVISPDFQGMPDPDDRVEKLLGEFPDTTGLRVLVGSSMGGYVVAQAADRIRPDGMLLMAPALYFPNFDREPPAPPSLTHVVHGWADDIVPLGASQRFAETHGVHLHVVPDDHMLHHELPLISHLFSLLLDTVRAASEQPADDS